MYREYKRLSLNESSIAYSTVVVYVGKSKFTFDFQANITFASNGEDKANILVYNAEGIVAILQKILGFVTICH